MRYRVSWSASSNISFTGSSDWEDWDDPAATVEDVEDALNKSEGPLSDGFEMALDGSGFEWWVEVESGPADHSTGGEA